MSSSTVGSVLAAVGGQLLQALCLPGGPDVVVRELAMLDPAEGFAAGSGSLLLAVGCRPDARITAVTIAAAAAGGSPAVIIKSYGDDVAPAVRAATAAGVALLLATDGVPWSHLHLLLTAALSRSENSESEPLSAIATGDLFALANAVAVMVGGAVTIEDVHQQVLAYSTVPGQLIDGPRQASILGRRVPAEFQMAQWYERLRAGTGAQRMDDIPGQLPRTAVAIRAGAEPLGSIWAIEPESGLAPDAERALLDAARLASLHILRLRTTSDVERTARAEALRSLLLGRPGPAADVLPAVGRHDVTVVAFSLVEPLDDTDGTLLSRVADLVTVYSESLHRTAACLTLGDAIYALLPTERDSDRTILPALIERVQRRVLDSLRVRLRAGIGCTVTDLALVAQSRADADRVVQVLAGQPNGPMVATIADVRSRAILLHLKEIISGDARFGLDVLSRIVAHDAEKNTDYVATLRNLPGLLRRHAHRRRADVPAPQHASPPDATDRRGVPAGSRRSGRAPRAVVAAAHLWLSRAGVCRAPMGPPQQRRTRQRGTGTGSRSVTIGRARRTAGGPEVLEASQRESSGE